jgi:predicted acetyltransferase
MTDPSTGGAPRAALRLRPLGEADEVAARAAGVELQADGFVFCPGLEPGMSWRRYLALLDARSRGKRLPRHHVASSVLVADVGGVIVGRCSVRHRLNQVLEREGCHIGYAVRPVHRRQGFAPEILRQSLVVARARGIDRVLLTCDDDNVGSATVIERCGGVLDSVIAPEPGRRLVRRYWIR